MPAKDNQTWYVDLSKPIPYSPPPSNRPGRWATMETIPWLYHRQERAFISTLIMVIISGVLAPWGLLLVIPLVPFWIGVNLWRRHLIAKLGRRIANGEKVWVRYARTDIQLINQGHYIP